MHRITAALEQSGVLFPQRPPRGNNREESCDDSL